MRETLAALVKLQKVDLQLRALEQAKGDLPQKVNMLEQEIAEKEEVMQDRVNSIENAQSELRNIHAEIAVLRERLKKYQGQLYQVKTNKEYDAITVELETTETAISQNEYKALEVEDHEKELQVEAAALTPVLDEERALLSENRKQLEAMLEKTREQEENLMKQRQEITVTLTRPVLSTYERIRHGRGGVAVAFLKEGACSQCSSRIPPQRGLEIRMMNRIILCEVCGRIMLWDPERD